MNRDLLGNALRKGSRSLSICMPTSLTVAPAPFFVLLMFLLFSISVILYWFSIYSQKVVLIDAILLRVLAWRAILLAGHTSIYHAWQGVVFVGTLHNIPALRNPYRVSVVADIIANLNWAVLRGKCSCQHSSFVLSLHVDFVQGFSVLLFCHCLLCFFNCLSNFVFIRFILCSILPICL